jgi:hypothetical protein
MGKPSNESPVFFVSPKLHAVKNTVKAVINASWINFGFFIWFVSNEAIIDSGGTSAIKILRDNQGIASYKPFGTPMAVKLSTFRMHSKQTKALSFHKTGVKVSPEYFISNDNDHK